MVIHRVKRIKVHLSFVKNRRKDPSFIFVKKKSRIFRDVHNKIKLNYRSFWDKDRKQARVELGQAQPPQLN